MLLSVKNSPDSREVTRRDGHQRRAPSVWIAPIQEQCPFLRRWDYP